MSFSYDFMQVNCYVIFIYTLGIEPRALQMNQGKNYWTQGKNYWTISLVLKYVIHYL